MCCLEREERSKRQVQEKYVVAAGPSFLPFASAIVKGSMRFYGQRAHLTPSAATAPYPPPSASPIAEVPYLASLEGNHSNRFGGKWPTLLQFASDSACTFAVC